MTIHPIDALETLIEQGRAVAWEVERKEGGIYWLSISYVEYDDDSPRGVCNVVHGHGDTLGEAVQMAVRHLPAQVSA